MHVLGIKDHEVIKSYHIFFWLLPLIEPEEFFFRNVDKVAFNFRTGFLISI